MVNLAVAHFFVLHEVEIINTNWLLNEKVCAWPPYKNTRLYKALLSAEQPTEDWKLYKIAILGYYDSYEKALQKCLKTKSISDLETEPSRDEKKTRKKRKLIILSDSEEEEERCKLPHLTIVPNPPCLQEHASQTESLLDVPEKVSNNFPQAQLSDASTSVKKQMLITLLDIQRMLKEHTVLFNKLLIKEPKSSFSVEFLAHLPIKCMMELEELENILQNDEYFAKTVQFLGKRCEYDFKATTRSMLHFLLVDEVASKFNWAGRGEKLEFRKLRLKNVVVDAVKGNVNAGNVPIKLIEDTIKDWLKFAPSRILYRKSKEELM